MTFHRGVWQVKMWCPRGGLHMVPFDSIGRPDFDAACDCARPPAPRSASRFTIWKEARRMRRALKRIEPKHG